MSSLPDFSLNLKEMSKKNKIYEEIYWLFKTLKEKIEEKINHINTNFQDSQKGFLIDHNEKMPDILNNFFQIFYIELEKIN